MGIFDLLRKLQNVISTYKILKSLERFKPSPVQENIFGQNIKKYVLRVITVMFLILLACLYTKSASFDVNQKLEIS